MASINGIILRVKKVRNKENNLMYKGDLFIRDIDGLVKIADWHQSKTGKDRLTAEPGFERKAIISAIKGSSDKTLEDILYDTATLAEYESWFKKAKSAGFFGVAFVQGEKEYIGKNIFSEEKGKDLEKLLKDETKELKEKYPDEEFKYFIFTAPTDFMVGEPIYIDDLKEATK